MSTKLAATALARGGIVRTRETANQGLSLLLPCQAILALVQAFGMDSSFLPSCG